MRTNMANSILSLCFLCILLSISIHSSSQTFNQIYDNDVKISGVNKTAQTVCNCDINNFRMQPENNIPTTNTPMKTVKIDFNIMRNANGGGNFQDTQNDIDRLKQIKDWVNDYYNTNKTNNIPPTGVTVNDLTKTYIQFELGDIYFYNDATLFKSSDVTSLLNKVRKDTQRNPNAVDDRLQIFFTEGFYGASVLTPNIAITNGGSGYTSPPIVKFNPSGAQATVQISNGSVTGITVTNGGSYTSTNYPNTNYGIPTITFSGGGGSGATAVVTKMEGGASAYANMPRNSCFLSDVGYVVQFQVYDGGSSIGYYAASTTLAHELGHNLDLAHTYSGGGAGANCTSNSTDPLYLKDVFGLPASGNCPHNISWNCGNLSITNKIDNNIMGGNQCAGYFSPLQIGMMHSSLSFQYVRKYVKDCPYTSTPLTVSSDETWDFDIKLYSDIVVSSGATLTLQCNVWLCLKVQKS